MALDTEPSKAVSGVSETVNAGIEWAKGPLRLTIEALEHLADWLSGLRIFRVFTTSLLRRILITNLLGLAILIGGIFYLSQYQEWLVDAKTESLKIQGEILAGAISGNARIVKGSIEVDPARLPGTTPQRAPFRDDGFAALEMSLRPENVTPILRRLVLPTKNRARVYDREGSLVVDTGALLSKNRIIRPEPITDPGEKPRTRNFWTRLTAWLIGEDLPVYREIGQANGTAYKEVRDALKGETSNLLLLDTKGQQIVTVAVPIKRREAVQGVLLLSTLPGEIDKVIEEEQRHIWTIAAMALFATLITSLMLARTVAGPIRRLSDAAEHVSRYIQARQELPDYSDRADEVGQMSTAFKTMTSALYKRIEASERFAADVAHELKNPLAAARSTADSLSYAKTEAQRDQLVRQIQFEIKRLNRLITDVSNASRLDAELARQNMQPLNIIAVVSSVAQIFKDILSESSHRIVSRIEPEGAAEGAFVVNGVDGRLGQVLTNLVDNAISFSPEAGTVTIIARHMGSSVRILVEDEGPGIPADRLDVIFDRFYTDRPETEATKGKNSGLGLSISREIIHSHGGRIWAENRAEGGARFAFELPALLPAARGGTLGGGAGGRARG